MKISNYIILFLLVILSLIISFISCGPLTNSIYPECTTKKEYFFKIPFKISPQKYEFTQGDTIRIDFDFSDEFIDEAENKKYFLKDFRFSPIIRLIKLDSFKKKKNFFEYADTCNMDLKNMSIYKNYEEGNDTAVLFEFEYKDNRYNGSLSFILKNTGIYYFDLSAGSDPEFPSDFDGRCVLRLVAIGMRHPYETNFDLVKWLLYPNADPRLLEHTNAEGQFRNIGGYAFEVK